MEERAKGGFTRTGLYWGGAGGRGRGPLGELAAVTADIPAGLTTAKPPTPARAQGGQPVLRPGPVITVATVLYAGAWVYAPLSPHGGDNNGAFVLVFFGGLLYLITLAICVAQVVALWRAKRSGGQSPRRPALGGGRGASPRPPAAPLGGAA